jgi:hypothetical protein
MVRLLPSDAVERVAMNVLAAMHDIPVSDLHNTRLMSDLVFAQVTDAKCEGYGPEFAVVCTEGVGWQSGDDERILVPMQAGFGWTFTVPVSVNVLRRLAEGAEVVDLADHVRRFGDRLECNWGLWHESLVEVGADVEEVLL